MKVKSYPKIVGLGLLAFILVGVAFGSSKLFSFPRPEFLVGQKLRENESIPDKDKIVMVVNGMPVTKKDFENQRALLSFERESVSDDEVREKIIEKTVLYEEAKKRGLTVSLEEAKQFSQRMKKEAFGSDVENPELIKNYIEGQGLTIDEFFDKVAPPLYQQALSIGKLRAQIYDETDRRLGPNVPADQRLAAERAAFEKLTRELKEKAVVEIKSR
ncbi:MAG: hypothetical protein HPY58_07700 [Firmicutes bacterium]|nr:hypothetical protein [Bacillota bacterium]